VAVRGVPGTDQPADDKPVEQGRTYRERVCVDAVDAVLLHKACRGKGKGGREWHCPAYPKASGDRHGRMTRLCREVTEKMQEEEGRLRPYQETRVEYSFACICPTCIRLHSCAEDGSIHVKLNVIPGNDLGAESGQEVLQATKGAGL
jgi:hypothetical protein